MGDVIIGWFFSHFGSGYLAWAQTAKWKYFAQVLLETRLESKSFGSLISFLAFLVQKLWLKNNK